MMPERTSFCALGLSVMAVQDVFFFFFCKFCFRLVLRWHIVEATRGKCVNIQSNIQTIMSKVQARGS